MRIDKCSWHVDAEKPPFKERALNHFSERWTTLLDWMREEHLLADPSFGMKVSDWMEFEIQTTAFTEEGQKLLKLCIGTWSPAFGQARSQKHLIQWKRKLKALREKAPN